MLRRVAVMLFGVALSHLILALPATAQGRPIQSTDPHANSPAGVVYGIPLDSARQDAAPHRQLAGATGGTAGTGGPGGGGVPGVSALTGARSGSGTASAGAGPVIAANRSVLVLGGQPDSLIHSANGFGSSSAIPGVNAPLPSGLGAVQNDSSSAPVLAIVLAAVVLLLGGYVGTQATRGARQRKPDADLGSG